MRIAVIVAAVVIVVAVVAVEHELQFGQFVESIIALCAEHELRYAQSMDCSLNMNCSFSVFAQNRMFTI